MAPSSLRRLYAIGAQGKHKPKVDSARQTMQNGFIEKFNRSCQQDVLDVNLFSNLAEVKMWSDDFEVDYNEHRPHESLGNLSPFEYKQKHH